MEGLVMGPQLLKGLFIRLCDMPRRMHANRLDGVLHLIAGTVVEVNQRLEPGRIAADNRQHQLKIISDRAHHRLRRAANPDPDHKASVFHPRKHPLFFQGRTQLPFPCDHFVGNQC